MPHWALQTLWTASYWQPTVAVQSASELISEHVGPHEEPVQRHAVSALHASMSMCLKRHSILHELPVHLHMACVWQLAASEICSHVVVHTPDITSHIHNDEADEHDADDVIVLHAPAQLLPPQRHCVSRLQVVSLLYCAQLAPQVAVSEFQRQLLSCRQPLLLPRNAYEHVGTHFP
jgi:hypothetical protein